MDCVATLEMTGDESRRMGGAKRYPSMPASVAMGIASLHPSYGTEYAFAISRHDLPEVCISLPPLRTEGAGKTGCWLHPRSRVQGAHRKTRTRAYRFSGS